jgi:hypothetical protein
MWQHVMLSYTLEKVKLRNDCAPSNEQNLTLKSQKSIEKVQVGVKKKKGSKTKFLLQKS